MGKKILIVDDETKVLRVVELRLKANGYEVITAQDGEEGLQKARTQAPDLIILDIMLPKVDGYKVCGLLKNDARFCRIPVILFTAKVLDQDRKTGEEVKADAYLTKPYEPEILLGKIKELMEKQARGDTPQG